MPNLWFACGSPFTKTTEITKTTETTKTIQTAKDKELSVGLTEITETTEMTKTTEIQGANHGFPKPWVWKYLMFVPPPDKLPSLPGTEFQICLSFLCLLWP